jgi:hypothetical protein
MIYNAKESTYASEQIDISTYLTLAVKNTLACGAVKICQ